MKTFIAFAFFLVLSISSSFSQSISYAQHFCLGRPKAAVKKSIPTGYTYFSHANDMDLYRNAKGEVIGYEYDADDTCIRVATQMPVSKMKAAEAKLAAEYRLYEDMFYTNPGYPFMYFVGTSGKTKAYLIATKNIIN